MLRRQCAMTLTLVLASAGKLRDGEGARSAGSLPRQSSASACSRTGRRWCACRCDAARDLGRRREREGEGEVDALDASELGRQREDGRDEAGLLVREAVVLLAGPSTRLDVREGGDVAPPRRLEAHVEELGCGRRRRRRQCRPRQRERERERETKTHCTEPSWWR